MKKQWNWCSHISLWKIILWSRLKRLVHHVHIIWLSHARYMVITCRSHERQRAISHYGRLYSCAYHMAITCMSHACHGHIHVTCTLHGGNFTGLFQNTYFEHWTGIRGSWDWIKIAFFSHVPCKADMIANLFIWIVNGSSSHSAGRFYVETLKLSFFGFLVCLYRPITANKQTNKHSHS